jgi:hypothetical protein
VGTVVETDAEYKSNGGHRQCKLPYMVSVSFGDTIDALKRWGVRADSDTWRGLDSDDSESLEPDQIVHGEWIKGSANNIQWWYPAEALRLASPKEAAAAAVADDSSAVQAQAPLESQGSEGAGSASVGMRDDENPADTGGMGDGGEGGGRMVD